MVISQKMITGSENIKRAEFKGGGNKYISEHLCEMKQIVLSHTITDAAF